MAVSRVPYLAFDFLLNHLANLDFNFLLLVLPGALFPGVRFFDPLVAADLHLAGAFFFLADSDVVLVCNFFLDVFANADLLGLLFGLANGDLVGVGLFLDVAFVDRVFHFSFHEFRNPNLADGGGGTAAAGSSAGGSAGRSTASAVLFLTAAFVAVAGVFNNAFFPGALILADLAFLHDGDDVRNVTDA